MKTIPLKTKALSVFDELDDHLEVILWRLVFRHAKSIVYHDRTIAPARNLVKRAAANSLAHTRRQKTLDAIYSRMYEHMRTLDGWSVYGMHSLAENLFEDYKQTGIHYKLDDAVRLLERAVNAAQNTDQLPLEQRSLVTLLAKRYETSHQLEDLNRAINIGDAVNFNLPELVCELHDHGLHFFFRFERTGSLDDLNRAIKLIDESLNATLNDADRAKFASNLSKVLEARFDKARLREDIDRAIDLASEALDVHPDRTAALENLTNKLRKRSRCTESVADLDRAIQLLSQELAPYSEHSDRSKLFDELAICYSERSTRTKSIDDSSSAINLGNEALKASSDTLTQATRLAKLANYFFVHFRRTNSLDDLNRGVELQTEALDLTPSSSKMRSARTYVLSYRLMQRYLYTSAKPDLERALAFTVEALRVVSARDGHRPELLFNLGILSKLQFVHSKSIEDYNVGVEAFSELLELTPLDHPERASRLKHFKDTLSLRSSWTGSTEDFACAAQVSHELEQLVLSKNSTSHLKGGGLKERTIFQDISREYFSTAHILRLHNQYESPGSIQQLDHIIEAAGEALKASFKDPANRLAVLTILGITLCYKCDEFGSKEDLEKFLPAFKQDWDYDFLSPSNKILFGTIASTVFAYNLDWEWASKLAEMAVQLVPFANPRSLKHVDRQGVLKSSLDLGLIAAGYALEANKDPYVALKVLELGRGVIAGSLVELRGDLSHLEQQNPHLAIKFTSLRDELDRPAEMADSWNPVDPLSWELKAKKPREAEQRMNELIREIRAQPGLSNFFLPPIEDELKHTASLGPIIVVNVTPNRCDAFLIEYHQIRVLNLPGLMYEKVEEHVRDILTSPLATSSQILTTLEWLWDTVAGPCLDALGFRNPRTDNNMPHVWWIPTGPLSHLPLHAAGRHMDGSKDTVLDRVISSYSLTVKTLAYGRGHNAQMAKHSAAQKAILVAMQETPGNLSTLPFATEEIDMLEELCQQVQLEPIQLYQPTQKQTLDHLKTSTIFHFAGHGRTDASDPSLSSLLLEDWQEHPLTMGHLRDLRLQENAPFLAYLSACSTNANAVTELNEEGINLVSGCQLAGFRHVIGTQWKVSDRHCVDVAKTVYETLRDEGLTDRAVALGLHRAVKALRHEAVETGHAKVARERREWMDATNLTPDLGAEREGRDGTLIKSANKMKERAKELVNTFWVPYVHYGV